MNQICCVEWIFWKNNLPALVEGFNYQFALVLHQPIIWCILTIFMLLDFNFNRVEKFESFDGNLLFIKYRLSKDWASIICRILSELFADFIVAESYVEKSAYESPLTRIKNSYALYTSW